MPQKISKTGSELFIVDNSDAEWKAARYLRDWCQLSKSLDIATGFFEVGSLLALDGEWQKVDEIRILMGGDVSLRTKAMFVEVVEQVRGRLDDSLEAEKQRNDFLTGVPAIVDALKSGKIKCRVYRKDKFHAKAYITHARLEVVGSAALVGSSNFTLPGLTENIELNVQITGSPVTVLQEWYEEHWAAAEDVTPDMLRAIERHTQEYSPFEVYAKSLHELLRHYEQTDQEWFERESKVYPVLAKYQKDGFHEVMQIANRYRGAFLCDGVGLGKTFIALMAIEYLIRKRRDKVLLLVPKAARKPVWEAVIKKYVPKLLWPDSNLLILNHTDLLRKKTHDVDYPALMEHVREEYHSVVIDEAHHFRNPGVAGEESDRKTRYRQLFDMLTGKNLFLVTATPVNNSLLDLQHLMELFSQKQADYFKDAPLGIHSLPGHFRKLEKALEASTDGQAAVAVQTNQAEAQQVLFSDQLFRALVVQRSRAYVEASQKQEGETEALFPKREDPKVQPYSVKNTYGTLLRKIDKAFAKAKPLFSLPLYSPLLYHKEPAKVPEFPWQEGRQKQVVALIRVQFLKRFESSAVAFEASCQELLRKLLAFVEKHSLEDSEKRRLEKWLELHGELIDRVERKHRKLWSEKEAEDCDEDLVTEELLAEVEELPRAEYNVPEMLADAYMDLGQIVEFLQELGKFRPKHDDKLKSLVKLLKSDPVLKDHKVLIFSEYMTTARYLQQQLEAEGLKAVDEVDSARASSDERGLIIKRFAPYYNDSSSAELKAQGEKETRILISTDVLSEGLNLQDATRLINYDLHWNPVRLMQRIGRVDRRMDTKTEARLVEDHPDQKAIRGKVAYWNFLPPEDLEMLLRLYSRVSGKVLAISKVFGIEGKKLLKPEDDYEALKNFTHDYQGTTSPMEELHLEYERLLKQYPDLAGRLRGLPGRVFSGKAHPKPGAKAVFFCFAMPAPVATAAVPTNSAQPAQPGAPVEWAADGGDAKWYLYDLTGDEGRKDAERIIDEPPRIVEFVRSTPETPRQQVIAQPTLSEIRGKVEKHVKNTYLKQVQAPQGVKPALKAWMELS
jgi:superfamily II DNA or RNA helicase